MKLLVNLKNKELDNYLEFTNSFIVGLKGYCVNYLGISLDEIRDLLNKYPNIELFLSINKNIFNEDIADLKEILKTLEELNVKGILFYDLSVLKLVKDLNINIPLCFHQTHMVTNYNICNYYYDKGCKYAYLSTEITVDEMREISHESKVSLMAYFIGHPIISHSKRKLVSNFYEFIGKNNDNKISIIKEKNKDTKYYIEENSIGTNILTYDVLNGSKAFLLLKNILEYGILDSNLIDDIVFLKILKLFKDNLVGLVDDSLFLSSIEELIGNYEGFFFKKTIYKVK